MEFEPNKRLEIIHFGKYDWLVLKREKDHMLLLMEDVLEEEISYFMPGDAPFWEDCNLRSWLNEDFYDTFTSEEQARILETQREDGAYSVDCEGCKMREHREDGEEPYSSCMSNPESYGCDTYDKIFLLTKGEAEKYLTSLDRAAQNSWWLMTYAITESFMEHTQYEMFVTRSGDIDYCPGGLDGLGFRPALNLKYNEIHADTPQ